MGFGRQLIGWIAAYAFVLHAVFAGAVATQLAATSTTAPAFELCLSGADGAPGHTQSQHADCAIHCAKAAGAVPVLALALLALIFPPRAPSRPQPSFCSRVVEYTRRAGLSRAPPLPA